MSEVSEIPSLIKEYGVKSPCVLRDNLEHFNTVTRFPPEIMHELLEGITPTEMSINDLISKKYIYLESLNEAIKQFPPNPQTKLISLRPSQPLFSLEVLLAVMAKKTGHSQDFSLS